MAKYMPCRRIDSNAKASPNRVAMAVPAMPGGWVLNTLNLTRSFTIGVTDPSFIRVESKETAENRVYSFEYVEIIE